MYIIFCLNRNHGIPWSNLIAMNSDSASVMKGHHNSVISRLRASQPHVQDLACICHLVQMATGAGMKASKIGIEDILQGIYGHFDKRYDWCVFSLSCILEHWMVETDTFLDIYTTSMYLFLVQRDVRCTRNLWSSQNQTP